MKFMIVAAMLVAACVAQQQKEPIPILKQSSDITPEGGFAYSYETGNGIAAQAEGTQKQIAQGELAQSVQGGWAYTDESGNPIQVSYIADENGFQPQGAHLPVPPPIPEAILKSLEYIRSNPPHPDYTQ